MAIRIRHAVLAGVALACLTVPGCANGPQAPGSTAGAGSAAPASPQPAGSAGPPTSAAAGCEALTQLTVEPQQTPPHVCLPVDRSLTLDTPASAHQPWQPFASSDPQTMTCTSNTAADGGAHAVCRTLRPGTVVITTGTAPFSGDPHGPAQTIWQLTVTVTQ